MPGMTLGPGESDQDRYVARESALRSSTRSQQQTDGTAAHQSGRPLLPSYPRFFEISSDASLSRSMAVAM